MRRRICKFAHIESLVWLSQLPKTDLDRILRWCDNKNEAGFSEFEMCVKGLCVKQDMHNMLGFAKLTGYMWDRVGCQMQLQALLNLHLSSERSLANCPNTSIEDANHAVNNTRGL